jgi:phosphatidylglycerophosphatase GEP4
MPFLSNLPAARLTLSYFLHDPSSLLPHSQIPTFLSLPIPVAAALPIKPSPKIRAMVLDKDNTICPPNTAMMHLTYLAKLDKLRASPEFAHSPHSILIVSNTAGSTSAPAHEAEAKALEAELGIPVLRQHPERRKPFCGPDVLRYFANHGVTSNPAEIIVVGDRLATDVLLAREMGSWSLWVRDGFRNPEMPGRDYRGTFAKMEVRFERLMRGGLEKRAPVPRGFAIGEKLRRNER